MCLHSLRTCLRHSTDCAGPPAGDDELGSPGPATPPLAGEYGGVHAGGMEDVVARMRDLATNRGDASRRSKRERASLRSTFRGLCSAVEVRGWVQAVLSGRKWACAQQGDHARADQLVHLLSCAAPTVYQRAMLLLMQAGCSCP